MEVVVFNGHGNGLLGEQSGCHHFERLVLRYLPVIKGLPVQWLCHLHNGIEEEVEIDDWFAHPVSEELDETVRAKIEEAESTGAQNRLRIDELLSGRSEHVVVDLGAEVGELSGDEVGAHETARGGAVDHIDGVLQAEVPEGGYHSSGHAASHAAALDGEGDLAAVVALPRLRVASKAVVEERGDGVQSLPRLGGEAVPSHVHVLDAEALFYYLVQLVERGHAKGTFRGGDIQ